MINAFIQRALLVICLSCTTASFAQDSQALNEKVSVSGQMTTDKFSSLIKQQKFKSVKAMKFLYCNLEVLLKNLRLASFTNLSSAVKFLKQT